MKFTQKLEFKTHYEDFNFINIDDAYIVKDINKVKLI